MTCAVTVTLVLDWLDAADMYILTIDLLLANNCAFWVGVSHVVPVLDDETVIEFVEPSSYSTCICTVTVSPLAKVPPHVMAMSKSLKAPPGACTTHAEPYEPLVPTVTDYDVLMFS